MSAALEWDELWAALDANHDEWVPTTEEMFWNQLEVVPPRCQEMRAFLGGEPVRSNAAGEYVYHCFKHSSTGYYARNMTVAQFEEEFQ